MKKFACVLMILSTVAVSTFALSLSVGAKGSIGKNFDMNSNMLSEVKNISMNDVFDFGGGAYVDISILPFLGVQAEANLVVSSIQFANSTAVTEKYSQLLLDLPVMFWNQYQIGPFQLGFGVGPNFSVQLGEFSDVVAVSPSQFKVGVACGSDFKIFFGEHVGLVVGARFVSEFQPTEVPIEINGYDTGESYPSVSFERRSLYGNVGLEFKF